jgi:hypothetical protein
MNKDTININRENIKAVEFNLNNTDTISVPYECFNEFELTINNNEDDDITCSDLSCDIEDNGKIEFIQTFPGNMQSPIQVLNETTITSIDIIYKDNTEINIQTNLYYDENCECNIVNQDTTMLTYKNIHISIKPYIKSYLIYDLFKLPTNTKLKDDTENTYIILLDDNDNKYLANHKDDKPVIFNEINVQAKYYIYD